MRFVPLNCVIEGYFLGKNLYDSKGRILLKKGTELTDGLIAKMRDNGFNTIYINDEYSNNEIEDIIKPQLRVKAVGAIRETFEGISKSNKQQLNKPANLRKKQNALVQEKYISSLNDISKTLVDEIASSKNVLINLVDIKNMDSYTYEHSLSVAILSLVLGIELRLNKIELYNLCIGALLHDIGKAFISKDLLFKKDKLADDEYRIIKEHPLKGYDYLKNNIQLTAQSRIITLQHHERLDGSGYPNGLSGDKINKLAKIVAIADVYDAFTSDRPYKKASPPHEAIEYIMGSAGRYFDFDMVQAFIRKVVPYPVGTLVKLSNGEIALVEETNPSMPLRPKVKIVKQLATSVKMDTIDLVQENNLVIEGIQYEIPNPSVQNYLKEK